VTLTPTSSEPFRDSLGHVTVAELPVPLADTDETASGNPAGVIPLEASDAFDQPEEFNALTLNWYLEPFFRPVTVHEVVVVKHVEPPGLAVTS